MTSRHAALLNAIAELGERYPDWRFGQLVANVADWADTELWDIDDERLLDAARAHLDRSRASEAAASGGGNR
ncbi:MAG: hypothetical protein WD066_19135 [Planctomycetaceae bacterium]